MRLVLLAASLCGFVESTTARAMAEEGQFKNMSILHNGSVELEDNNLEKWQDKDVVEVYLAEYQLQHMALSSWLGFSTSHMGVMFQNPLRRKWYVMDSFAKSAETIANIVMPSIPPYSPLHDMSFWQRTLAYLNGDIVDYLSWDNLGYVRMREERTDEFQDMRHIGTTTAGELKRVRTWVIEEYAAQNETHPFTFDMWQIYNASTNERIRKSRMCHDFLEDVLGRLQFSDTSDVMAVDSKVSVFRDSLNLNITQWTNVDMSNNKIRRDYQRFLRFFQNHIYEATRDMSFSRVTVTKIITLGLPFILFLDGNKYVKLSPSMHGVFNYCRMPMDFVKDQPYVPAKLDDERKQCFLPHYNYFEFKENIRFTFADYLIWAEQKLDDAIFGVDGNGVDLWTHLALVTETLVVLIAVTRLIKWTAGKISRV